MLVAKLGKDQLISMADPHTLDDLKKLRDTCHFYCPACDKPVFLKLGDKKRWHFSHRHLEPCPYDHEPESMNHLLGKKHLYYWLIKHQLEPHLEKYLPQLKQRPDLFLPLNPLPVAIEYQCASIPISLLNERTLGYFHDHIKPIWILGENRLRKKGHIFHLSAMDFQAIQYHSKFRNPHPFSSPYFLLFYNPKDQSFIQLSNIHILSAAKILANCQKVPLQSAPLNILTQPIPQNDFNEFKKTWLKEKKKKRLNHHRFQSQAEHYIKAICYRKRITFSFFPSYVGLPHYHYLYVETPPILWQSWLALNFIEGKKGQIIQAEHVVKAFKRMADKGIFYCRPLLVGQPSLELVIETYLKQLSKLNVIEVCHENTYRVLLDERWDQTSLQLLLDEDHKKLDELEWQFNQYEIMKDF
ncbi:competence protein CoiA [Scopulibacillus cellulosilyticus]|uniref:Competence protein CoiA n=1 Tax=Scopulibacillus cellulosilyticus TaxID=2665665 RepID=A0ABW2PXI3_9BACL